MGQFSYKYDGRTRRRRVTAFICRFVCCAGRGLIHYEGDEIAIALSYTVLGDSNAARACVQVRLSANYVAEVIVIIKMAMLTQSARFRKIFEQRAALLLAHFSQSSAMVHQCSGCMQRLLNGSALLSEQNLRMLLLPRVLLLHKGRH